MHDFSGGGVERMRLSLAEGLLAHGWQVTFIVRDETGPLRGHVPEGIKVISLGKGGVVKRLFALVRVLRREQPDILTASLDHNNVLALLAKLVSFKDTRIFICQHNSLAGEGVLGRRYRLVPLLYRMLAPWAEGVIAVSEGVAGELVARIGIEPRRVTTIYNPVIDANFGARASAAPPHVWLAQHEGPVFVFAGRLVAQKAPENLLFAFGRLENPAARLIFIGDGPLRPFLEELTAQLLLKGKVHFAGFEVNPLPWLAAAEALVLPSRYEGFGNVIVEALGCGVPVIATDCQFGPSEILERGRYGTLVPVDNVAALANALVWFRKEEFPANDLRRRAAEFTAERCVQRHMALFEHNSGGVREIFGLRFTSLNYGRILQRILATAPASRAKIIVTTNAQHVCLLQNQDFAQACAEADIVCPDGFPVAFYAWLRGAGRLRRVTGCDLLHGLLIDPGLSRHLVFAVVETESTAAALTAWAARRGLAESVRAHVAARDLLNQPAEQRRVAAEASAFGATILVMTLGAPVSEVFAYRHRECLPPCWVLCVGQALRVELGLVTRAPRVVRALALEWFWRILQEPRRLAPRYLRAAIGFPVAAMRDAARAVSR
jgi:exopolysaccharide biosynthesis WecB/TagA/CpsF family protein